MTDKHVQRKMILDHMRQIGPITRAEAMKIINCALLRGVNETSELGDFTNFPDNSDSSKWYYYEVIEAANDHEYIGHRPNETWVSVG